MANRVRNPAKEQMWRGHFAAWRTSGLGIRVYCDRYQLNEPSFYAWRRVLAKRDENSLVSPLCATNAQDHRSSSVAASPLVEVQLPTGTVLRVPIDVGGMTLESILKALQQASDQSVFR